MTVVTGLVGTAIGGGLLDFISRRHRKAPLLKRTPLATTCLAVVTAFSLGGGIICAGCFFLDGANQRLQFLAALAAGELLLLATTSPTNGIFLWYSV